MKELLEILDENSALKFEKTIHENDLIEANKYLPSNNPIDRKELSKITDEIFAYPSRNLDIIKVMREYCRREPKEKDKNINS